MNSTQEQAMMREAMKMYRESQIRQHSGFVSPIVESDEETITVEFDNESLTLFTSEEKTFNTGDPIEINESKYGDALPQVKTARLTCSISSPDLPKELNKLANTLSQGLFDVKIVSVVAVYEGNDSFVDVRYTLEMKQ